MGIDHGLFCLGCCWLLMVLPFAAGVMNLMWVSAMAAFILAEKAAPGGQWFGKIGGAAMVGVGVWSLRSAGDRISTSLLPRSLNDFRQPTTHHRPQGYTEGSHVRAIAN